MPWRRGRGERLDATRRNRPRSGSTSRRGRHRRLRARFGRSSTAAERRSGFCRCSSTRQLQHRTARRWRRDEWWSGEEGLRRANARQTLKNRERGDREHFCLLRGLQRQQRSQVGNWQHVEDPAAPRAAREEQRVPVDGIRRGVVDGDAGNGREPSLWLSRANLWAEKQVISP